MLPAQTPTGGEGGEEIYSQQFYNQKREALLSQSLKKENSVFIGVKGKLTGQKLTFLYKAGKRII